MADARFDVNPDIRHAETISARVYNDPAVYRTASERIFGGFWQLVADVDQVRVPGQVYPFPLLPGCLDEPLLLTRDRDDRLHCLSNVCTHRGNLVCEAPGVERHLRCRYHARRFKLDGRFDSMPEFEDAVGFPRPQDDLPRLPLERWKRFLFTAVAPRATFAEWIEPIEHRVGWMPVEQFRFEAGRSRDYLVEANWALYCENYLEGFHIPFVHQGLNEAIDYGQYDIELFRYANLQLGVAQGGEHVFDLPSDSPDAGRPVAAYYFWLFPNLMLNFYPWGLSINIVKPLGVNRTRVSFLAYIWHEEKLDLGAGAELDRVEREDEAIVEAVQRGVRSRFYDRGRYSPKREQACHHFHRLLVEYLNA